VRHGHVGNPVAHRIAQTHVLRDGAGERGILAADQRDGRVGNLGEV